MHYSVSLIINNLYKYATFVVITQALVSYYYLLIIRLYSYFPRMYPVSLGSHPGHCIISHLSQVVTILVLKI